MTDVWMHLGPTALAAFLASLVECVEALTIVLAVGAVRGWRDALGGCLTALFVLAAIVAIFGRGLAHVPLPSIQLFVGALLLLFGLRWLRKAILRSAGVIPLHDETGAFQKERQRLALEGETVGRDKIAFATSFQVTMLEGAEVVFIVLGIGAGSVNLLRAGSIGALAALAFVIVVGTVVRRPLATVPENELKFVVGILLSAFGTFWFGEGAGLAWPGADWSLVVLIAAYLCVALIAVRACHSRRPQAIQPKSRPGGRLMEWTRAVLKEMWALLVDDGVFACGILLWLGAVWLLSKLGLPSVPTCLLFFAGLAALLLQSALKRAGEP